MKRLLLILTFLLPALAFGQKHAYFGTPTTIDSFNLTMWVRQFKMPRVPLVNPYFDSVGSVYLNTTTGTIYFHDGGGWQPIAGGGGGGGLQHAGPWLTVANDTVYFDTVKRLDYVLANTDLKVPTAKAVRTALGDSVASRQNFTDTSTWDATRSWTNTAISGKQNYTDTSTWDATKANVATKVNYSDTSTIIGTKANLNLKMNYTDTVGLSNRINTKQNYSDTTTWDATRSWVTGQIPSLTGYQLYSDTSTFDATRSWVNTAISSKVNYSDTSTIIATKANVNAKQNFTDTTTWDATKANIATKVNYSDTSTIIGTKANLNLKLNASDTSSNVVTNTSYRTLTQKRITYRTSTAASYTTSVTIPADSVNIFIITAQAGALLFNAPSGTPTEGQVLEIVIKDNNTARALTWNAIFDWSPPSTTILGKWKKMFFQWNATTSKWNFMRQVDEP